MPRNDPAGQIDPISYECNECGHAWSGEKATSCPWCESSSIYEL